MLINTKLNFNIFNFYVYKCYEGTQIQVAFLHNFYLWSITNHYISKSLDTVPNCNPATLIPSNTYENKTNHGIQDA